MKFELPENLKVSTKSVGSIISLSTIIGIVCTIFSCIKLDKLLLPYKIIVILSIFLFIAIVDIILLYIRDREIQYRQSCLDYLIQDIDKRIETVTSDYAEIRKENKAIITEIKSIKFNSKL